MQEHNQGLGSPYPLLFPVCTLLVLRQVYTYSEEQRVWQICLLILNLVDIAALILLDYLEEKRKIARS